MAESSRDRSGRAVQRPSAATQPAPARRASMPDREGSRGRAQVPRTTGGNVYGRPRRTRPVPPEQERAGRAGRPGGPGGPGGGSGGPDGPDGPEDKQYRGRRNWRRTALIGGAVVVVLAMLTVGGVYMYAR